MSSAEPCVLCHAAPALYADNGLCGVCWFETLPPVEPFSGGPKAKVKLPRAPKLSDEDEEAILENIENPMATKQKTSDPLTIDVKAEVVRAPVASATPAVDHKSRGHAPYSPSMLNYLEKCSHYTSDQTGDKSAADAGTRQHEAVESGDYSKLDQWQTAAVKKCESYWDALIRKDSYALPEVEIKYLDQWGFTDLCVFTGTHCDLVDWKFGRTPVPDAEENKQGHAYAWGIFNAYPKINTIRVHFVAPYLDEITIADFSRDTFAGITHEIMRIVAAAKDPKSPYTPGKHCDYCGSKATCPKLLEKAVAVVSRYDNLPVPVEIHSSAISDPKDMATAIALATVMEKWSKSVKVHALELALNGVTIPGYGIAERKGNRTLGAASAVFDLVKDQITAEEFIGATKVSAAELEEIVCSKAPRGEKAKFKQALEDKLIDAELLERGEPSRYLKAVREETE